MQNFPERGWIISSTTVVCPGWSYDLNHLVITPSVNGPQQLLLFSSKNIMMTDTDLLELDLLSFQTFASTQIYTEIYITAMWDEKKTSIYFMHHNKTNRIIIKLQAKQLLYKTLSSKDDYYEDRFELWMSFFFNLWIQAI